MLSARRNSFLHHGGNGFFFHDWISTLDFFSLSLSLSFIQKNQWWKYNVEYIALPPWWRKESLICKQDSTGDYADQQEEYPAQPRHGQCICTSFCHKICNHIALSKDVLHATIALREQHLPFVFHGEIIGLLI